MPLKTVIREHRGAVLLSVLLTWMLSGAIVVIILMTPVLLQKSGVPLSTALRANSVATFCLTLGCLVTGAAIDRVGAGRFFVTASVLLGISIWTFYTKGVADPSLLFPLYAITGFLVGIVSGVPYVMVRAFPAAVRFTGLSFSYNVAYAVFGGLTPVVMPLLLIVNPMAHVYYLLALCALGCAIGLWLLRGQGALASRYLALPSGSQFRQYAHPDGRA